jgi:hypothetical protein
MRFNLRSKFWKLLFVRQLGTKAKPFAGECDFNSQTIRVVERLRGRELLDTVIHEMLHAVCPDKREPWVNEVATDMSKVLWRLGYRNVGEKDKPAR